MLQHNWHLLLNFVLHRLCYLASYGLKRERIKWKIILTVYDQKQVPEVLQVFVFLFSIFWFL